MPSFVDALRTEISLWGERLDGPEVTTVFFGGGTPSYLPTSSISELLESIMSSMRLASDAEITLEANPDDVHADSCEAWLDTGFNRISLGVQSLNDGMLLSLTRRHSADAAVGAVKTVQDSGFENISIDLMFGLPDQPMSMWEDTLKRAVDLRTEHLSLYGLQIEPGTPLHRDVSSRKVPMPDDDLAADMYELAIDVLEDAGYEHYEISNWAMSGYRSRHNLAYWLNLPYLGVGPGAHSSMLGKRFANLRSPRRYVETMSAACTENGVSTSLIAEGDLAIDFVEETSASMAMSETMMLGMRLADGVSDADFQGMFGVSLFATYSDEIEFLVDAGLVERVGDRIKLTRRGRLLANDVFERFLILDQES